MGGSGLDWTDDFQQFYGSGLDRIWFYQIRTGLGLKNFTVRSSLVWSRLNMIRFPDHDPIGFCNLDPDPDRTGFWKKLHRIRY